jgi:hypothetical protein
METIKLSDEQKFDAIKHRHENQAKLLVEMSHIDLKVFISFLTLQVVLGGFISQFEFSNSSKIGLFLIDIALSLICTLLLLFNYKRRKEVVGTIKNCNKALGYETPNIYIEGTINVQTKFRPWFWMYFLGIFVSIAGIALMLFFGNLSN